MLGLESVRVAGEVDLCEAGAVTRMVGFAMLASLTVGEGEEYRVADFMMITAVGTDGLDVSGT